MRQNLRQFLQRGVPIIAVDSDGTMVMLSCDAQLSDLFLALSYGKNQRMTARTPPLTDGEIAAAAARAGLSIPDEAMPGVVANLALLAKHAERLLAKRDDHPR